jgi:4,5-dihydroxyphthalate decarboxylase
VRVTGAELTVLELSPPEIFARFVPHREWHISELSLAKYVALRASGDTSLTAIPVFTSRSWRHSAIFVRADGPQHPRDLVGTRIGVPEWAQTAAVWTRALLKDEWNVDLRSVSWVQAGLDGAGRKEKVGLRLPQGIEVTPCPDRTLDDMLQHGEIDAIISAHPPASARRTPARTIRMPVGGQEAEQAYARRSGVFPIMHLVAIRSDVNAEHTWLAANLLSAFTEAKRRSLARITDRGVSRYPVPWLGDHLAALESLFGRDPWPYGLAANRTTLESFISACVDQGVAQRAIDASELFAATALEHLSL